MSYPQRLLDFGCGPGRDLKAPTERGALVIDHDLKVWSHWLRGSDFTPLRHYYRPEDRPLAE